MNQHKRFGSLTSSVDGEQLAATVTGIIRLISGAAVTFGFMSTVDMETLLGQIMIIVPAGVAVYGAAETIFGLIRKIVVRIAEG